MLPLYLAWSKPPQTKATPYGDSSRIEEEPLPRSQRSEGRKRSLHLMQALRLGHPDRAFETLVSLCSRRSMTTGRLVLTRDESTP